jgi:membrane protease YdiL (CAAX protease family)
MSDKQPGGEAGRPPGETPGPYPGQPQPYPGQAPYPSGYSHQPPWPPPSPYGGPPQPWGAPQPWGPMPANQPPQRLPSFPHPEPREYHQMLRTWNYAWWRPVVGILLVVVGMVIVAPLVLMPVLAIGVAIEGGPFWESFQRAASLEAIGPASLLYLNLTLGAAILVTWFVMRVLHRMRPRWLTSVVPKMRWKFFLICVGLSFVALLAQVVVSAGLPGAQEADITQEVNDFTRTTAILALIILLTTPLQAAGEEYVFRGYLMQALGSLFNNKWVALVVTATLFAMAHGVQNFPLFFDRLVFGLIAGWLVIRTGGLEAGIAMHILNNFLAFGFALTFSDLTETLNVSEVGWENIPLTLTQAGTYAALVLLVAKRMRLQRRTCPPTQRSTEETTYDAAPVP